jgi:uroporphyrinogen decarboxylase
MDRYVLFNDIIGHKSSHCGFWHGVPHSDSQKKLFEYFGVKDDFELSVKLGDTFVFVYNANGYYKSPNGEKLFDLYKNKDIPHLSELTDDDLELAGKLNWSDPKYFDFSGFTQVKDRAKSHGIPLLGSAWASFFTASSQVFGMENYFVKMHTDPKLVTYVTDRIVDFFLETNKKFLDTYSKDISGCFFGIDLGTQRDLMISPEMFGKFVLPYFKKLSKQAKDYGVRAVLHSCGSIAKAIPGILEAGFDGLHPIQALAWGMSAENLSANYKDKIVFIGGVDTQVLLREGNVKKVKDDVRRLKSLFGNNFIVSPSHESILPDVPPENIAAMAEAAWE